MRGLAILPKMMMSAKMKPAMAPTVLMVIVSVPEAYRCQV